MLPREDHLRRLDKSINIQEFASYSENYINDNLVLYLFWFIRNWRISKFHIIWLYTLFILKCKIRISKMFTNIYLPHKIIFSLIFTGLSIGLSIFSKWSLIDWPASTTMFRLLAPLVEILLPVSFFDLRFLDFVLTSLATSGGLWEKASISSCRNTKSVAIQIRNEWAYAHNTTNKTEKTLPERPPQLRLTLRYNHHKNCLHFYRMEEESDRESWEV